MKTLPPVSHTFLDTFARCPKQAWHRYIVKDQPYVETAALKWGNDVHTAMEKRLADKTPLPETMRAYETYLLGIAQSVYGDVILHVEQKLGVTRDFAPCDFFAHNVFMRGKVDVLLQRKDAAFIFDWKTGKEREDASELEEHALLVQVNYPEITYMRGVYVWLKNDKIGELHNLSHFDATKARILKLTDQAQHMLANEIEWPARENPLCGWCSVTTCRFNPGRTK